MSRRQRYQPAQMQRTRRYHRSRVTQPQEPDIGDAAFHDTDRNAQVESARGFPPRTARHEGNVSSQHRFSEISLAARK